MPGSVKTPLLKHPSAVALWASVAAFGAYFCTYAFRKPFAAASFGGLQWAGVDYKIVLVTAQLFGYMASKFWGVKLISELRPGNRIVFLVGLLAAAELALVLFAVTPFPFNFGWLFVNGVPLGMVFGVVFSFLEGRRLTELMSLGLGVSIIFASGAVKSLGKIMLDTGQVSEWWMPALVGLLAVPLLAGSVWMLTKIPPPDEADIRARTARQPMTAASRRALFGRYAPGIVLLVLAYIVLTAFRDLRDNFAVEIWAALGFAGSPGILAKSELAVAVLVLFSIGSLSFVQKNALAFGLSHGCIAFGGLLLGGSTWLFQHGQIGAVAWMVASGFGLFLAYTVYQGIIFERMLATFRESANVGFLMYLADSFGYLGSAGVLLWRNFGSPSVAWLDFFVAAAYVAAVLSVGLAAAAWGYFSRRDDC